MPLAGPVLGSQIFAKFTAKGFTGSQTLNLSIALGNGIVNNILATNFYSGTTIGTGPGPGTGTGRVSGIVGSIVGTNIFTFMTARGMTGSQALNTAMAIGEAFADHMNLGIVNSIGGPTAVGSGTGVILGVVGVTMATSILTFMTAAGLTGSQNFNIASAIADGVALSISTGIVTTSIVGVVPPPPAGPYPAGGVETGKLI